jgi:hypothetical protein
MWRTASKVPVSSKKPRCSASSSCPSSSGLLRTFCRAPTVRHAAACGRVSNLRCCAGSWSSGPSCSARLQGKGPVTSASHEAGARGGYCPRGMGRSARNHRTRASPGGGHEPCAHLLPVRTRGRRVHLAQRLAQAVHACPRPPCCPGDCQQTDPVYVSVTHRFSLHQISLGSVGHFGGQSRKMSDDASRRRLACRSVRAAVAARKKRGGERKSFFCFVLPASSRCCPR